ncbi:type II toxin-antitoxin system ParD family antitoxin [Sphingobium xenophagum]|uniref:Antitoxin ParD1/3/4 n=1 Tax=Sphingobium xenophagum TaxID=121428 RepID=A0A401J630_SPHXE|nr:type II toxin-antitoxin system ParD family antitoxin [Sphingobium xenophagum]GBH32040.1 antitoxin ParD1/3/4 [Sphingobium xenophagum]
MNISLPDGLKSWIEARVTEGRYSSSDYVRDLVRREQEAEEKLHLLRAAIEEGLASPETDATIADIIADGRARRAARSSAG